MQLKKHTDNPILIPYPEHYWENLAVCNPGVWYEDGVFYMLYRAAGNDPEHPIFFGLATSRDGLNFQRESDEPVLSPSVDGPDAGCVEDPRIVKFGDFYCITYAYRPFKPGQYWLMPKGEYYKPLGAIENPRLYRENLTNTGLLLTKDFRNFVRLGRITEPNVDNRDVVFFPEQIDGKFVLLHRKMEMPGVEYPAMWIAFNDSLMDYNDGELFAKNEFWWETKVGANCPPIRTQSGWLILYHGVCPKGLYRVGAMLADLEDPRKIIARTPEPILEPEHSYEMEGYYNGCVFPCGNVVVDGILYVYYGAADKYVAVATCALNELVNYLVSIGQDGYRLVEEEV